MKLNKIPKSELELLPYTEIAKMYLEETKKTMNTADLFKEVCSLLELDENDYVNLIADFFQSLTTSKEFILLEDGTWDLKSNHKVKVVLEDIDEENNTDDIEDDKDDDLIGETDEEPDDLDSIDDTESFIDDDSDDELADLRRNRRIKLFFFSYI